MPDSLKPMRKAYRLKFLVMILLWISILSVGCRRETRLDVLGDNIPIFSLKGSGALVSLKVAKMPDVTTGGKGDPAICWEIQVKEDILNAEYIDRLGAITYGEIPQGYVQVSHSINTPLPLLEGERYEVVANCLGFGVKGARKVFTIVNGSATEIVE